MPLKPPPAQTLEDGKAYGVRGDDLRYLHAADANKNKLVNEGTDDGHGGQPKGDSHRIWAGRKPV